MILIYKRFWNMEEHSTDVSFSGILKTGVALLVVAVVIHLLMWFLFNFFNSQEAEMDTKPSPMFQKDRKPPDPILQISPPQELESFRNSQTENLDNYGWVNPEKGIVRIPIDQAMKLVIEREKAAVTEPPEDGSELQRRAAENAKQ
jgi:hypothetical protein